MKKPYMKPSLYVENFSLTQSIAAGCTAEDNGLGKPALSYASTCGWSLGGQTFFTAGVQDYCTAGDLEFVCYNAPNGNIMFAS